MKWLSPLKSFHCTGVVVALCGVKMALTLKPDQSLVTGLCAERYDPADLDFCRQIISAFSL